MFDLDVAAGDETAPKPPETPADESASEPTAPVESGAKPAAVPADEPVAAGALETPPGTGTPAEPVPAGTPESDGAAADVEGALLREEASEAVPAKAQPVSLATQLKPKVEALLFASPAPLRVSDLVRLLDCSKHSAKRALDELASDLTARYGALTVSQHNGFYSIVLKTDYQELAQLLMPPELEPAQLKTLSVVAVNQPLTQKRLVELRGSSAYEHMKALVEKGYVRKRREGNTYLLRTTKVFATRFRVEDDPEKIREAMALFEQRAAELAAHVAAGGFEVPAAEADAVSPESPVEPQEPESSSEQTAGSTTEPADHS